MKNWEDLLRSLCDEKGLSTEDVLTQYFDSHTAATAELVGFLEEELACARGDCGHCECDACDCCDCGRCYCWVCGDCDRHYEEHGCPICEAEDTDDTDDTAEPTPESEAQPVAECLQVAPPEEGNSYVVVWDDVSGSEVARYEYRRGVHSPIDVFVEHVQDEWPCMRVLKENC